MTTSVLTDGLKAINYSGLQLAGPIVVDEERGRIFVGAWAGFEPKLAVIAAATGDLITTHNLYGELAFDRHTGWLMVEEPSGDMVLFDTTTDQIIRTISLPELKPDVVNNPNWRQRTPPQLDTVSGNILVALRHTVYVIDPIQGIIIDSIPFLVYPKKISQMDPTVPAHIDGFWFDPTSRILHLSFLTYVSGAGYFSYTLVTYNLNNRQEIERFGEEDEQYLPFFDATITPGFFYTNEDLKSGIAGGWRQHSIWFNGQLQNTLSTTFNRYSTSPIAVDKNRHLLYELAERNLRIYDPTTFELLWLQTFPYPVEEQISAFAYEPANDQLLIANKGDLLLWPANHVHPPLPTQPTTVSLPEVEVEWVTVSPLWPEDQTIVGIWREPGTIPPMGNLCGYFDGLWGTFYFSTDGGQNWLRPQGGLQANCIFASNVAFSSNYQNDHTIFVDLIGKGTWQSNDQGQLWQPTPGYFDWDMIIDQRSENNGHSWATVLSNIELTRSQIAYYENTYFIITKNIDLLDNVILRSTDSGLTWQELVLPDKKIPTALAISPDFANDHLIFVGTADGQVLLLDGLVLEGAP